MIRCIVAIDSERGLADNHGIPWQGKVPTDARYFREQTTGGDILMGFKTYQEFTAPLPERRNYVLTHSGDALRDGFLAVMDVTAFLAEHPSAWVIGGAGLFAKTIDVADELYITQLEGTFSCTRFFPAFEHDFVLADQSEPLTENGITYSFQIWRHI